jgi:hypothetical protein
MKSWATRAYPDLWLIFLGGMFIFVTVFMPKGIVGLPEQFRRFWKRLTCKPIKDDLVPAPEGVTELFTRVWKLGKSDKSKAATELPVPESVTEVFNREFKPGEPKDEPARPTAKPTPPES